MRKYAVLLVILLVSVFITGCGKEVVDDGTFSFKVTADSKKFATDYAVINVSSANPFDYVSEEELLNLFKSGKAIVFFGFPTCPWCQSAIPNLIDAAREMKIETIYYFNPSDIRSSKSSTYVDLMSYIGDFVAGSEDDGSPRLTVPDVYFIDNGTIIGSHADTVDSQVVSTDPLTDSQKKELRDIYKKLIAKLYNVECDC